jgi:hypothetical protein
MNSSRNEYSATEQPTPIQNQKPAVWDLVIKDMTDRDQWGRSKYGTPLQPFNGRDALVDLYQELLDAVVYCRQVIEEIKTDSLIQSPKCDLTKLTSSELFQLQELLKKANL